MCTAYANTIYRSTCIVEAVFPEAVTDLIVCCSIYRTGDYNGHILLSSQFAVGQDLLINRPNVNERYQNKWLPGISC